MYKLSNFKKCSMIIGCGKTNPCISAYVIIKLLSIHRKTLKATFSLKSMPDLINQQIRTTRYLTFFLTFMFKHITLLEFSSVSCSASRRLVTLVKFHTFTNASLPPEMISRPFSPNVEKHLISRMIFIK